MDNLIARIEAGTAEQQRELLVEAWEELHGPDPIAVSPERLTWLFKRQPFQRMLDAEAYENAAKMLIPPMVLWKLSSDTMGRGDTVNVIIRPNRIGNEKSVIGCGSTEALAIAAAALRAKDTDRG